MSTENAHEVSQPSVQHLVTYDETIELERGQFWVLENKSLAFILEINQYGVLFQSKYHHAITDDDSSAFDFEAGQEVMTLDRFKKVLTKGRAVLGKPKPILTEIALTTYRKLRNDPEGCKIIDPKDLPKNEDDYNDLFDDERYRRELRIVPPPRRYRDRRGIHWLRAGMAGQCVAKLWDPEKDNWIDNNGLIDVSAALGFVTHYHGMLVILQDDNPIETFENLCTRVVDLLRKKRFMFDEKHIRTEMLKYKDCPIGSSIRIVPLTEVTETEPAKYPVFDLNLQFEVRRSDTREEEFETNLVVSLIQNNIAKNCFIFSGIQNGEFIPNRPITLGELLFRTK